MYYNSETKRIEKWSDFLNVAKSVCGCLEGPGYPCTLTMNVQAHHGIRKANGVC